MGTLLKTYKNLILKFPFTTQAVQAGIFMGCGDAVAQTFVEKRSLNKMDLVRMGQFAMVGTFFVGPPLRLWYGIMDKYFGNTGKTAALKKVCVDQLLFAPAFIAIIMTIVGLIRGNSFEEVKRRVRHDYPDVLVNNYKLWPAVQLCNFYLVPLQFQVITVQFVAIFWNTYLSWKMNQSVTVRSW